MLIVLIFAKVPQNVEILKLRTPDRPFFDTLEALSYKKIKLVLKVFSWENVKIKRKWPFKKA